MEVRSKGTIKETQKNGTFKSKGRYPTLYTEKPFLETLPEMKASLKPYFDTGYIQLYFI